jgi:rhodanese-related sulfurtransferase
MIKRFIMMAAAATLFVGAGNVYAQCDHDHAGKCSGKERGACCSTKEKGASLSSLKSITKDDLVSMLKAKSVTVFDARDSKAFAAGHIEGALNVGAARLPADKNAKIVFYCGGLKCPAAAKAAKQAVAKGYKNVMVYHGGWTEWSQAKI